MGTRRAISMPGLLWLKYTHLHQRRRMTKEVTEPLSSFCVACDSDNPNKRLQAHSRTPPRRGVSQMSGAQAWDPMLFTPESDALGVYRTPLVWPQQLQDRTRWVGECGLGARETSFSRTTSSFLTCGLCDFRLVPEVAKPQPVPGTARLPLCAPNRLESWLRAASWSSRSCSLALRLRCDPGAKATFLRALLRREAIRCLMGLEHRCIPLAVTITG